MLALGLRVCTFHMIWQPNNRDFIPQNSWIVYVHRIKVINQMPCKRPSLALYRLHEENRTIQSRFTRKITLANSEFTSTSIEHVVDSTLLFNCYLFRVKWYLRCKHKTTKTKKRIFRKKVTKIRLYTARCWCLATFSVFVLDRHIKTRGFICLLPINNGKCMHSVSDLDFVGFCHTWTSFKWKYLWCWFNCYVLASLNKLMHVQRDKKNTVRKLATHLKRKFFIISNQLEW